MTALLPVMTNRTEATGPSMELCLCGEGYFTSQYLVMDIIGQGGCGVVKRAVHRFTECSVAVKILEKKQHPWEDIQSEVETMRMMDHPNIISLFQIIETPQKVFIVMEFGQGQTLWGNISDCGYLTEEEAQKIFQQLLSAVSYCHSLGIAHRDIKPDNIVFDLQDRIKLIDFGMAARFQPGQMLEGTYSTLEFSAPEVFLPQTCDPTKIDVWSLGVNLYFMVTGTLPFATENLRGLRQQIIMGNYHIPGFFSRNLINIIGCILTANPKRRPTVKEIMDHPWLCQGDVEPGTKYTSPSCPDSHILATMTSIGFDPHDIRDSLMYRKCDEIMAIYSIFRMRASQEEHLTIRTPAAHLDGAHCPSPVGPAVFPLNLKTTVSIPALPASSTKGQLPKSSWKARERGSRRHTLPTTPTSCAPNLLSLDVAFHSPITAPWSSTPHSGAGGPEKTTLPQSAWQGDHASTEPAPEPTEAMPQGSCRHRRKWLRRKLPGLRKISCCIPCLKRQEEMAHPARSLRAPK